MVTSQQEVPRILEEVGAVIIGSHFVYASGKHGSVYVNKDAVYPHTDKTSRLCYKIAWEFSNADVEVVIAPAVGAVILSQWTAHHLCSFAKRVEEVLGTYADKAKVEDEDGFVIKRGYDKLIKGKRVLVVEDILTTGGSVKKVIQATRACGGTIVGVGALCNRGGITAQDLDVPKLFALMDVKLSMWDEADCPLCKDGVPINTDVGKGREFLARKQVA